LLPSSNSLAIVVLVSFVESFVSLEVLSLIVGVSDPLLAFLFEKIFLRKKEGKGREWLEGNSQMGQTGKKRWLPLEANPEVMNQVPRGGHRIHCSVVPWGLC
jgi:hypothetical protein